MPILFFVFAIRVRDILEVICMHIGYCKERMPLGVIPQLIYTIQVYGFPVLTGVLCHLCNSCLFRPFSSHFVSAFFMSGPRTFFFSQKRFQRVTPTSRLGLISKTHDLGLRQHSASRVNCALRSYQPARSPSAGCFSSHVLSIKSHFLSCLAHHHHVRSTQFVFRKRCILYPVL